VLVLYGVDPAGFELVEEDVPPGTDLQAIADLGPVSEDDETKAAPPEEEGVQRSAAVAAGGPADRHRVLDIRHLLKRAPAVVNAPAGPRMATS